MLQISPQVKLASWMLFLIILLLMSSKFFQGPFDARKGLGSVLGISISPNFFSFAASFSFVFQSSDLSRIIQKNITETEGEFAIYVEDLSDGESYGLNQFDQFPSASLYKLFLIAAVLKETSQSTWEESKATFQVTGTGSVIPAKVIDSEANRLIAQTRRAGIQKEELSNGSSGPKSGMTMQTKISASKSHLAEVLGSVDFGYEETPEQITYTVDEALQRVGRISDNFASIMLAEKIGWSKVQEMADSLGTTNTIIKSPIQTTAADIALFFKKLHRKEIVSIEVSNKIEEILSLNQLSNRIPAGLPEGVKTVHKTGELARVRHDGGIVYLSPSNSTPEESSPVGAPPSEVSNQAYVIVLLSKDLKYEDEGIETLAKISKDVYEYFKNKSD